MSLQAMEEDPYWSSTEDVVLHENNVVKDPSYYQYERRVKYREKYAKIGDKRDREVHEIQQKIVELSSENEELRIELQSSKKRRQYFEECLQTRLESYADCLPIDESEVKVALNAFTEVCAEYGQVRSTEIESHFCLLKKLTEPCNVTRMYLWIMIQDNKFFKSSKSPVIKSLQEHTGLTRDQVLVLRSRCRKIRGYLSQFHQINDEIDNFQRAMKRLHNQYVGLSETAAKAGFSSSQILCFLQWIKTNMESISKLSGASYMNNVFVPNLALADAELLRCLSDIASGNASAKA